jgi:TIR domain
MSIRTQVFVSYSHADSEHLLRLKVHLRPYERQSLLDLWADTKIRTGQQWKKEIQTALDRAAVAIVLVSADFLASDFVAENELPPLLDAARREGVKILPVILKPCSFSATRSLSDYQAVNDPARPLIAMSEAERESIWVRLAGEVNVAVQEAQKRAKSGPSTRQPAEPIFGESWGVQELLREEITKPDSIKDFHVYQYEHVDFLGFMPRAQAVLHAVENADAVLKAVGQRFKRAGWEGDGEIQLMWLPPFVGAGVEDTWGVAVWFVKQDNNGTAFIASPVPLPFSRLLEQQ